MSDWWYIIAIVIIAAVAVAWLLSRRTSSGGGADSTAATRDYREERETSRLDNMSDEDREWEAASQQRNREAQERDQAPPGSA